MDDRKQSDNLSSVGGQLISLLPFAIAITAVAAITGFFIAPRSTAPRAEAREDPGAARADDPGSSSAKPVSAVAQNTTGDRVSDRLFRGWPAPELALLLSGQQHGYLQPCGCSYPQKGGLARRFNFLKTLIVDRKWPVIAADLGDIAQKGGPEALLKYVYAMQGLEKLDYTAVGHGEHEGSLPLFDALGNYALNSPKPRVLMANLQKRQDFPGAEVFEVRQVAGSPIRVGFVGIVGPTVAQAMTKQDSTVKFDPEGKVLPDVLRAMQAKGNPELLVLLYQGYDDEAKKIAQQFPQFQIVLHAIQEEEPPGQPQQVGNTMVVSVGHKGRYVGVVGVTRSNNAGNPFKLRYQLVPLDPEFETPEGQDAQNPIHALLQEYANTLKAQNYLAKFPTDNRHDVHLKYPDAEYIGSDSCQACHKEAFATWQNSPHPHAYDTLVNKAKRPNLRQFDGECVQCHVTGFTIKTGFSASNQPDELKGVTCESCHGPCSLHKQKPKDLDIQKAINPWKHSANNNRAALATKISDLCITCHDTDNDVNFNFDNYWKPKKIAHYTPKKKPPPEAPPNGK
jgi:hypothetical protein